MTLWWSKCFEIEKKHVKGKSNWGLKVVSKFIIIKIIGLKRRRILEKPEFSVVSS